MRLLKRLMILLLGVTVLLAGTAMIILPGPAVLVIPAGLAILGVEFEWARRALQKLKTYLPRRNTAAGAGQGTHTPTKLLPVRLADATPGNQP